MNLLSRTNTMFLLLGTAMILANAAPAFAQSPPTRSPDSKGALPSSAPQTAGSQLFDGADLGTVLSTARQYGSAAMSQQQNGSPLIIGDISGFRYSVRFLNCENRPSCEDLNFRIGFQKQVELDVINAWNRGKRFSRAYQDDEGDAILEMDTILLGGVSAKNIKSVFSAWRLSLVQFVQHIGFE